MDRNRLRPWRRDFHGLLDDRFSRRAAHSFRERHSQRGNGADYRSRIQNDGSADCDSARPAWSWFAAGKTGAGVNGDAGNAQLQRRAPADACALLRTRIAWAWHHGVDCRLHVRHGGKRNRVYDGLDG